MLLMRDISMMLHDLRVKQFKRVSPTHIGLILRTSLITMTILLGQKINKNSLTI